MTALLTPPKSRIWTPEPRRVVHPWTSREVCEICNRRKVRCCCTEVASSASSSSPSSLPSGTGSGSLSFSFSVSGIEDCNICDQIPLRWQVEFANAPVHRLCPSDSPLCDILQGQVLSLESIGGGSGCAKWSVGGNEHLAECGAGALTACGFTINESWSMAATIFGGSPGEILFELIHTSSSTGNCPGGQNTHMLWENVGAVNCTSANTLSYTGGLTSHQSRCLPITPGNVTLTPV
jgi:hypothetical protein